MRERVLREQHQFVKQQLQLRHEQDELHRYMYVDHSTALWDVYRCSDISDYRPDWKTQRPLGDLYWYSNPYKFDLKKEHLENLFCTNTMRHEVEGIPHEWYPHDANVHLRVGSAHVPGFGRCEYNDEDMRRLAGAWSCVSSTFQSVQYWREHDAFWRAVEAEFGRSAHPTDTKQCTPSGGVYFMPAESIDTPPPGYRQPADGRPYKGRRNPAYDEAEVRFKILEEKTALEGCTRYHSSEPSWRISSCTNFWTDDHFRWRDGWTMREQLMKEQQMFVTHQLQLRHEPDLHRFLWRDVQTPDPLLAGLPMCARQAANLAQKHTRAFIELYGVVDNQQLAAARAPQASPWVRLQYRAVDVVRPKYCVDIQMKTVMPSESHEGWDDVHGLTRVHQLGNGGRVSWCLVQCSRSSLRWGLTTPLGTKRSRQGDLVDFPRRRRDGSAFGARLIGSTGLIAHWKDTSRIADILTYVPGVPPSAHMNPPGVPPSAYALLRASEQSSQPAMSLAMSLDHPFLGVTDRGRWIVAPGQRRDRIGDCQQLPMLPNREETAAALQQWEQGTRTKEWEKECERKAAHRRRREEFEIEHEWTAENNVDMYIKSLKLRDEEQQHDAFWRAVEAEFGRSAHPTDTKQCTPSGGVYFMPAESIYTPPPGYRQPADGRPYKGRRNPAYDEAEVRFKLLKKKTALEYYVGLAKREIKIYPI